MYWHFYPTAFVDFCRKGSRQAGIWLYGRKVIWSNKHGILAMGSSIYRENGDSGLTCISQNLCHWCVVLLCSEALTTSSLLAVGIEVIGFYHCCIILKVEFAIFLLGTKCFNTLGIYCF